MHSLVESKTADNDQEEDKEDLHDSHTQSKRSRDCCLCAAWYSIQSKCHETAVSVRLGILYVGESAEQTACSTVAKVLDNLIKKVPDNMK
jgi:hypothetical protein